MNLTEYPELLNVEHPANGSVLGDEDTPRTNYFIYANWLKDDRNRLGIGAVIFHGQQPIHKMCKLLRDVKTSKYSRYDAIAVLHALQDYHKLLNNPERVCVVTYTGSLVEWHHGRRLNSWFALHYNTIVKQLPFTVLYRQEQKIRKYPALDAARRIAKEAFEA